MEADEIDLTEGGDERGCSDQAAVKLVEVGDV